MQWRANNVVLKCSPCVAAAAILYSRMTAAHYRMMCIWRDLAVLYTVLTEKRRCMALYTLVTGLLLQWTQLGKDTPDSKRSWGLFLSGDARTALQHLSSVSALCASSSPRLKSHPFAFLHLCSHTTASPLFSFSCPSFFALFFLYLFPSISVLLCSFFLVLCWRFCVFWVLSCLPWLVSPVSIWSCDPMWLCPSLPSVLASVLNFLCFSGRLPDLDLLFLCIPCPVVNSHGNKQHL